MATQWEVSVVVDSAGRFPIGTAPSGAELEELVATAQQRIDSGDYPHPSWKVGAILIQRSDQTLEAQRKAWFDAFYDVDRRGYKRRRYKRPDIEKQWEAWAKAERAEARAASQQRNAERG